MRLIFATGNRHKFKEVSKIAAEYGVKIEMCDVPYGEVQADELEAIARRSAADACSLLRRPCFVEDAGLFVQALKGFPGPYSSFVFRTLGNAGLLKLMLNVKDRKAEFKSVVGYCEPGSKPLIFQGKVKGSISFEARGSHGFGFDPIFIPEGRDGRTFAEMGAVEKNEISHRAMAIKKFLKWYVQRSKA
jgi:XTP/dITP diphosphohydrolase